MRKVSVIVYVNEAEGFVSNCLESLLGQTYGNMEFIFLNSSTMDNSIGIIKERAAADERVRLVHLDADRGPSAARNEGLALASGDYVQFVDATDWIDRDLTRSLVAAIEATDADFAVCGFAANGETARPRSPFLTTRAERQAQGGVVDLERHRDFLFGLDPSAVLALRRRDHLLDWNARFSDRPFAGDDRFHFAAGLRARSLAIVDGPVYHRETNARAEPGGAAAGAIRTLRECFDVFDGLLPAAQATRAKITLATRTLADRIAGSDDGETLADLLAEGAELLRPFSAADIYLDADPRLESVVLRGLTAGGSKIARSLLQDRLGRTGVLASYHMSFGAFEAAGFSKTASVVRKRFEPGWNDIKIDFARPQNLGHGRLRSLIHLDAPQGAALRFAFIGKGDGGEVVGDAYYSLEPGLNLVTFGREDLSFRGGQATLEKVTRIYLGGDTGAVAVEMSLALIEDERSTDLIALSRDGDAGEFAPDAEPPIRPLHLHLEPFETIAQGAASQGAMSLPLGSDDTMMRMAFERPLRLAGRSLRAVVDLKSEESVTVRIVLTPEDEDEPSAVLGNDAEPGGAAFRRELLPGLNLVAFGLRELGAAAMAANPLFGGVRIEAGPGSGSINLSLALVEADGRRDLLENGLARRGPNGEAALRTGPGRALQEAAGLDLATLRHVAIHTVGADFDLHDVGVAVGRIDFAEDWTDYKIDFAEPLDLSAGEFRSFVRVTSDAPLALRYALVCRSGDPTAPPDAWHVFDHHQRFEPGLTLVTFGGADLKASQGSPRKDAVTAVYFGGYGRPDAAVEFSLAVGGAHASVDLVATAALGSGVVSLADPEPLSAAVSVLAADIVPSVHRLEATAARLVAATEAMPDLQAMASELLSGIGRIGSGIQDGLRRLDPLLPHNDASHVWAPTWAPSRFPTFFHGNSWSWADGFKAFHFDNRAVIDQLLSRLVDGLDAASAGVALAFWDAAVFKIPFARTTSSAGALLRRDYVFTARDLVEQQRILARYDHDVAGVELPNGHAREVPVFCYHHGLRDLDPTYLAYLADHDALDCGGFVGDSAYVLARNYPFRRVVSIEADARNHAAIVSLAERYDLGTVTAINCGVGRQAGELAFFGANSVTSSLIGADHENAEAHVVPIETIDMLVERLGLSPRFIKMDIEGMETDALIGARQTLERHRPILAISIYHRPEDFLGIKPYLEGLDLDYTFEIQHHNPFDPIYETMLIALPRIADK